MTDLAARLLALLNTHRHDPMSCPAEVAPLLAAIYTEAGHAVTVRAFPAPQATPFTGGKLVISDVDEEGLTAEVTLGVDGWTVTEPDGFDLSSLADIGAPDIPDVLVAMSGHMAGVAMDIPVKPINSFTDLCDHFGSDYWLDRLNRRIYTDTECGAWISIMGKVAATDPDVSVEAVDDARRQTRNTRLAAEYKRIIVQTTAAYDATGEGSEERKKVEAADDAFNRLVYGQDGEEKDAEPFLAWARTVVPGSFPEVSDVPDWIPVTYHNGHRGSDGEEFALPLTFILTGFQIGSIVEGSDAEVQSDVFKVPGTTGEEIDAWIEDLESQIDDLWHEANDEGDDEDDSEVDEDGEGQDNDEGDDGGLTRGGLSQVEE